MIAPDRSHIDVAIDPAERSTEELAAILRSLQQGAGTLGLRLFMGVHRERQGEIAGPEVAWASDHPNVEVVTYWEGRDSGPASLNTAVAAAPGDFVLVLEDAFLFQPASLAQAIETLRASNHDWLALPVSDHDGAIETHSAAGSGTPEGDLWLREGVPLLCRRSAFLQVRGYDEDSARAASWSLDLRARLNRAGFTSHSDAQLAPVTHFRDSLGRRTERAQPPELLRNVEADPTIYRNLTSWSVPAEMRHPLVTVAIATRNRGRYLPEAIRSVLNQTFEDFELLIVDDGSDDDTPQVVRSFRDARIRYFRQPKRGISAARNRAADESRGHLTAVHDDDDLMLPDRVEIGLRSLTADVDAIYGSWINFEQSTGNLVMHVIREKFDQNLVAFNGQGPGHSTWLIPTAMIRQTRYDETYSSSVDHNLATRLAWQGCRWRHTGRVAYLRRVHSEQVSATDSGGQKFGHVLTKYMNTFMASMSGLEDMRQVGSTHKNPAVPGKSTPFDTYGRYLPDSLVTRAAVFKTNVNAKIMAVGNYQKVRAVMTERDLNTGLLRSDQAYVSDLTWSDMVKLRAHGQGDYELQARRRTTSDEVGDSSPVDAATILRTRLNDTARTYNAVPGRACLVAFGGLSEDEMKIFRDAHMLVRLTVASDDDKYIADVIGYHDVREFQDLQTRLAPLIATGRLAVLGAESATTRELAAAALYFAHGGN